MLIVWAIVSIAAASFCVTTGFFMVATARRIGEAGVKLHGPRRLVVRFWFYVGAISDAVYNATVGWARFREPPGQLMYSKRIQELVDGPAGWQRDKALEEARMLNAAWADHIKRVPPP